MLNVLIPDAREQNSVLKDGPRVSFDNEAAEDPGIPQAMGVSTGTDALIRRKQSHLDTDGRGRAENVSSNLTRFAELDRVLNVPDCRELEKERHEGVVEVVNSFF